MKVHSQILLTSWSVLICSLLLAGTIVAQTPVPDSPQAAGSDPDQEPVGATSGGGPSGSHAAPKSGGGILGPDYVLGPEDVLVIEVFNLPEMRQVVRVENDGSISVKLLGRVKAAGLTSVQLERELAREWGAKYLQDPQVTVFVREPHAQPVSVVGAVEQPGIYQLTGHRTLIDVLAMAGGLAKKNSGSAGRTVYITRKSGFGDLKPVEGLEQLSPNQIQIDLKKLLYSNNAGLNPEIKSFDTISVSKADIVYVVGAVKKPGGFELDDRQNVTALQALAMAEGFYGSPAKARSRIIRRLSDGSVTEIPIDLGKIEKGKSEDPILTANDILMVPDSASKAVMRRTMDVATSTVSGLLIYGRGL